MATDRSKIVSAATGKGGLGGLLGYIYLYFDQIILWQIADFDLQTFVNGCIAAFIGVGTIAGWNRDRPSPSEVISDDVPRTITGKVKNWFTQAELECKGQNCDCDFPGMDKTVMAMANDLRNRFGPVIVNSGHRCEQHNKDVGGVPNSYHIPGKALDIKVPSATPTEVYTYLTNKYPGQYGFGLYRSFVHMDSRTDSWARKTGPNKPWKAFDNVVEIA